MRSQAWPNRSSDARACAGCAVHHDFHPGGGGHHLHGRGLRRPTRAQDPDAPGKRAPRRGGLPEHSNPQLRMGSGFATPVVRRGLYGVAGAIDIENLPGVAGLKPDIAVQTDRAISSVPIRINSSDGYIQLSMSSESAGRLNLEGIGGVLGQVQARTRPARRSSYRWHDLHRRSQPRRTRG